MMIKFNSKLKMMWKEAVVSRIYVLLRYMPDCTEENCETYQLM
jgi:hypothetical protein